MTPKIVTVKAARVLSFDYTDELITHPLNTVSVIVQVYRATGVLDINAFVRVESPTSIKVYSSAEDAANVVIIG